MRRKSEVYSWRLAPALKVSLEEAARRDRRTISQLLDEIVEGYVARAGGADRSDAEKQRRLHETARRFAGCIAGRDAERAAGARVHVRARLRRRRRAG